MYARTTCKVAFVQCKFKKPTKKLTVMKLLRKFHTTTFHWSLEEKYVDNTMFRCFTIVLPYPVYS